MSRAHAGPGNVWNNSTSFHKNTKRIILGVIPVPEHPHLLVSQDPAGPAQQSCFGTTEKACRNHLYLQTLSKELRKSLVIFLIMGIFFPCLSSKLSIRLHLGSVCLTFHQKLKFLFLHQLITFGERQYLDLTLSGCCRRCSLKGASNLCGDERKHGCVKYIYDICLSEIVFLKKYPFCPYRSSCYTKGFFLWPLNACDCHDSWGFAFPSASTKALCFSLLLSPLYHR